MSNTGEQLKLDGITQNLAAATAAHRPYRNYAEAALTELIRAGQPFTTEDVRRLIPEDVAAHSPNTLPSLIGAYAAQGRIRPIGWVNSPRPTRHASRNRVWIAASAHSP